MSCCCVRVYDFCAKDVCKEGGVVFAPIVAAETGSYKLVVDFLGTNYEVVKDQTLGEAISFPLSDLNEFFEYTGRIFDPSGNQVQFTINEVVFDCVKFKTKKQFSFI